MVLAPWRLYEGLTCFNREMNQLFDRFFGRELVDRPWEKISYPPLTITENEKEIIIHVKVIGFSPEELEVILKENLLVIKGEKRKIDETKTKGVHYLQREAGSFKRTIHILEKIQSDSINAKYKEGNLMIVLPKIKEKPSSLKVNIE